MPELMELHRLLTAVLARYSTDSSSIRTALSPTINDADLDKVNIQLYQLRTSIHKRVVELMGGYLDTHGLVVAPKEAPKTLVWRG